MNVDGQEQIYTFTVKAQPVVIASCTTAVDPAAEPFSHEVGHLEYVLAPPREPVAVRRGLPVRGAG